MDMATRAALATQLALSSGSSGPGAPTGLTPTAGNAQVALTWTAPSMGSGTFENYVLYQGTSPTSLTQITTPTGTSYTVTGLTNGTLYYFAVAADTSVGVGPQSSVVSATPSSGSQVYNSNGYPLPDPTSLGSAPTLPFPGSPWTSTIPGSPTLASNSSTLVSNLVTLGSAEYSTPQVSAPSGAYARYAVHGNSISPWTTISVSGNNVSIPLPNNVYVPTVSDHPFVLWDIDNNVMWAFWQFSASSQTAVTCQAQKTDGTFTAGFSNNGTATGVANSHSSTTTASGASYGAGPITYADWKYWQATGLWSGHTLMLAVAYSTGSPVSPAVSSDGSTSVASGGIPEGTRFFFPSSVSMPSGLTSFQQMVFTAIKQNGMIACDQTGGGGFYISVESAYPWENYQYSATGTDPSDWMFATATAYSALTSGSLPWSSMEVLNP